LRKEVQSPESRVRKEKKASTWRLVGALLSAFIFSLPPLVGTAQTTQEVEESLTCQCSCGLTVHSCNHLQCGFAVPAKQTIAEQLGQGTAKEVILQSFVTKYGEKVLSSPTTVGFNLVAWLTPFLALIVGGIAVGLVSLRWSRQRAQQVAVEKPVVDSQTDPYRDRLQKELDSFDS
jgi:cytochrome c-type biogenesis protein CcmH